MTLLIVNKLSQHYLENDSLRFVVTFAFELDFGINGIGDDFYWYELYALNETDKKVYINTFTNNLIEGGPLNYNDLPSYHRLYDNNSKFELKPYSVNFLANSSFSNEIIGDTITVGNCDSYLWNGVSYSSSGFFSDTLVSVDGFDSIISLDLTIFSLPEVNAGADQTICAGETVSLSGSGATSYVWDNGVIDGASFSPSLGTTIYTLTGTDVNGCISSDQVDVTMNSNPEVSLNLAQDSVCFSADSLELFGLPIGGDFSGNGVNNNWFHPSLTGLGTHILTYTYIDSLTTCLGSDTILIEVLGCAGIVNLSQDIIQVYPNPTFDKITIVIDGYYGPLEVEIYDLNGNLIKTFNDAEFSIKEFARGTYILRINYKHFSEKINIIKF